MLAHAVQDIPGERASMDLPPSAHELFESLLEAHRRAILKICWTYGRTPHDRDDLLQEIVVRLWAAFGSYDRSRKFSTWMYRVALNVATDYLRRQRRWGRQAAHLDAESEIPSAVAADAAKREQLRELRELMEQQSDADRAILLLYLEGNSYREIGEVLGISESNAGTRLNRLKNSLRRAVQKTSDEQSGD